MADTARPPQPLNGRQASRHRVRPEEPLRSGSCRGSSLPSVIQRRWLIAVSGSVCVAPDGHSTVTFPIRALLPRPNSSSFECCEMKAGSRGHRSRDAAPIGFHGDTRADGVAVALRARQADGKRAVPGGEVVAEQPQLRRRARRHQHHVRVAVAVDVEDGERAAVLVDIEAGGSRDLVEAAAPVVPQQDVALVAGLRSMPHQQPGSSPATRRHGVPTWRVSGDRAVTCRQKKLSMLTSSSPAAR